MFASDLQPLVIHENSYSQRRSLKHFYSLRSCHYPCRCDLNQDSNDYPSYFILFMLNVNSIQIHVYCIVLVNSCELYGHYGIEFCKTFGTGEAIKHEGKCVKIEELAII